MTAYYLANVRSAFGESPPIKRQNNEWKQLSSLYIIWLCCVYMPYCEHIEHIGL